MDYMSKGHIGDAVVYHAGFPNAAEDQAEGGLSLDALVVQHRASTYFWRLEHTIDETGWPTGSIVVVDRAVAPRTGDHVVAVLDDAFAVRRFRADMPAATVIWGVVTYVLQDVRHS